MIMGTLKKITKEKLDKLAKKEVDKLLKDNVCHIDDILMEINKKDISKDKIEKINEVKSKILSNKAEAIAFMQQAGIYDEDGKLKEPYK